MHSRRHLDDKPQGEAIKYLNSTSVPLPPLPSPEDMPFPSFLVIDRKGGGGDVAPSSLQFGVAGQSVE